MDTKRSCGIMQLLVVLYLLSISQRLYVEAELSWEAASFEDSYRTCKYSWWHARLDGIQWGLNWQKTCQMTGADFDFNGQHKEYTEPDWCEDHGFWGEYAFFRFPANNCPNLHWDNWSDGGCAFNGVRKYFSILWNIEWGIRWEGTCWQTATTLNGVDRAAPARCFNSGFHIFGILYEEDLSCCSGKSDRDLLGRSLGNQFHCVGGGSSGGGDPPFRKNNPFNPGHYVISDKVAIEMLNKATLRIVGLAVGAAYRTFVVNQGENENMFIIREVPVEDRVDYDPAILCPGGVIPRSVIAWPSRTIQFYLSVDVRNVQPREIYVTPILAEGEYMAWAINSRRGWFHGAIVPDDNDVFEFRDLHNVPESTDDNAISNSGSIGPGSGYVVAWVDQIAANVYNFYLHFQPLRGMRRTTQIFQFSPE